MNGATIRRLFLSPSMSTPHATCTAYASAAVAAMLMGTLGFFVRESHCSAQCCSFARFFIGMLLLAAVWGWELWHRRDRFSCSGAALASGAGISLCILFYFLAIQYTSVGVAALLLYTGPVFAALGESLLHRKFPPVKDAVLISLAALGVAFVSIFAPEGGQGGSHAGLVYGILSGLCYSTYILFNRQIPATVSLVARTFWQSAAGVAILLLPLLFSHCEVQHVRHGLPYLVSIGFLQGFAVLLPAAYAMKKLSAIKYGTIAYLEPMVAVALGFFVYHEHITLGQWEGLALVVAATACQTMIPARTPRSVRRVWLGMRRRLAATLHH